jgi:hypothetical protein
LEKEVIFADDLERIFGPRAGAQQVEEPVAETDAEEKVEVEGLATEE